MNDTLKQDPEKSAMLNAIVEWSNDAIISKNLDGIITSWNPAAEKMFGYTPEEAIGKPITLIIPQDLRSEEASIISTIKQGEGIEHYDTVRRRKDGTLIDISLTVSPIKNMFGEIVGASKIARDISTQKVADRNQAVLAAVVDSSDDAIITKNLDGIITSWNEGAHKIFGYKAEEIIGKSILTLIPHNRLHEETEIIRKIRKGERIAHFDTIRVRKDGIFIHISLTISPVKDKAGNIIGVSKIARDITERVNIQKQLEEQKAKLVELNRIKDEFIQVASHELKTPLTSIKAYLQLLESESESENTKHHLQKTLNLIKKLNNLVSDMLDVSRIQLGKLLLDSSTFHLEELLAESIDNLRYHTSHTILREGNAEGLYIKGDKGRLEQVIVNLVDNAIKYSPKADQVIIAVDKQKDDVIISVRDFGFGIDPKYQAQIFEQFFRIDHSFYLPGMGLGLYIAHDLVTRHNGKMWVKSEPGKGSTFYFSLPIEKIDR